MSTEKARTASPGRATTQLSMSHPPLHEGGFAADLVAEEAAAARAVAATEPPGHGIPARGQRRTSATAAALSFTPPRWEYDKTDLRAFSKWERKIKLWRLRIQAYLPNSDAALFFYESLNGPPEEELEHASLERIKQRDGIDWMIDQLRVPLQEKKIYLKREFLADYE